MSSSSSPNDVMHVTLCRCAATGSTFAGRCTPSRDPRDTLPPMLAVDPASLVKGAPALPC